MPDDESMNALWWISTTKRRRSRQSRDHKQKSNKVIERRALAPTHSFPSAGDSGKNGVTMEGDE
jgi:hypothetical protein